MNKRITVTELRKQLEVLEGLGLGDLSITFRDWSDIDHAIEEGVYEVANEKVVLG